MLKATVLGYRTYTARQGDTYDLLSAQAYGTESMMTTIIKANPDYIDTIVFEGGETLRIPIVDIVETADTQPPWRR